MASLSLAENNRYRNSFMVLPPTSGKPAMTSPERIEDARRIPLPTSIGRFRWVICMLLFCATSINYMDRQVISYLKEFFCRPAAQGGFGWSNSDFSYLTSAFTGFYAGVTVLAGWFIDRIEIGRA